MVSFSSPDNDLFISRKNLISLCLLVQVLLLSHSSYGLFKETNRDLELMQDILETKVINNPNIKDRVTPLLLAVPRHYWLESRDDFAQKAIASLQKVFKNTDDLVLCNECDSSRYYSLPGQKSFVSQGELSLGELQQLRQDPRYQNAASFLRIHETPSGVSILLTSLDDGKILLAAMADGSKTLDDVKPWRPFTQELERRRRGEDLSYVFINLGLFPKPAVQLEWVEQWGNFNQHISGFGVSLIGPVMSIGGVYHYILPVRKFNVGAAMYYPLTSLAQGLGNDTLKNNLPGGFVAQISGHYVIGNTFGLYTALTSQGSLTLGLNFFNPLLMPFLF